MNARAHYAAALSLCAEGALDRALPHLQEAVARGPDRPGWRRDLGTLCCALERWHEGRESLTMYLAVEPADRSARRYLALAQIENGEAHAAIETLQPLVVDEEPDADVLIDLARALARADRVEDAIRMCRCALQLQPDSPRAHAELATIYDTLQQFERAVTHRLAVATRQPDSATAQIRLALAAWNTGQLDVCHAARQRAMSLGLQAADEYSAALYLMLFDPACTAASIRQAAEAAFAPAERSTGPRRAPRRDRPLRVGYVSGEFRSTPAFFFLMPLLANHDPATVDTFIYNNWPAPDACTAAYRRHAAHWRDVATMSAAEVTRAIASDAIDILVDLSGHFLGNRQRVFAARGAPIQVAFPNYAATTGCPAMDYFLTDRWSSPEGSEPEYSETLYRLPSGYLVYAPPESSPPVTPLPALARGAVTFGVFQRLGKITSPVIDAIAAVLRSVPDSRLLLHHADPALDDAQGLPRRIIGEALGRRGVDGRRVSFRGPLPLDEHLRLLGEVDLALDTFPFGGQTTTCECLWMGIPVVTLRGSTHVGRVSAALIERSGHPEWIADSIDDYVRIATHVAADIGELARQRVMLREEFVAHGLTDGRRLAREVECAYRDMFFAPSSRTG